MPKPAQGFMRPPKGLEPADILAIERFAHLAGIGPLYTHQPTHHGQHSWCCTACNTWRKSLKAKQQPRDVRQPWQLPEAA